MADPDCTYAVVDMSKKKKNRELVERNSSDTEATYYNMALYSMINYDAETQEPPASTTTNTEADDQNYSKLETFSKSKGLPSDNVPEPVVSTTSNADECNFNEKPGPKTNKKVAYCAVVVVLAFLVLAAIILLACVGFLFVEFTRLESSVLLQQQTLSDSLSQSSSSQIFLLQAMLDSNISDVEGRIEDQLMHQKAILMQNLSCLVEKIAEIVNLNQELHYNITNTDENILALQGVVNQSSSLLADRLSGQESLQQVLQQNLTRITTLEQRLEQQQEIIDELSCNNTEVQGEVQVAIQVLRNIQSELQLEQIPASSCTALPPSFPSGYYWVRASNGSAVQVYCNLSLECGGVTGWVRVAELDMTSRICECPSVLMKRTDSGLHSCVRKENASGCSAIHYSTYNIQYSKVCGRVIGYQIGDVNAFGSMPSDDISSVYVDGVSLTHGQSPRKHIWTFGASRDTTENDCPCTRLETFVEDHYFCDTANTDDEDVSGHYFNNSLWDGSNCIALHGCCTFNTPPWFYRSLPQSTTDDIEMRLCRDEQCCSENVGIQIVELYVQ